MSPPQYVLIGNKEEDEKTVAKLKASLEEEQKARKAAEEEKEKLESAKKAMDDEDKKEVAKKAIIAAAEEEEDPTKKASIMKATEIFDKGNGTNTNSAKTAEEEEKEEAKKAMKALTQRAAEPTINKMLSARAIMGAKPEELEAEKTRLSALTLTALDNEFKSQEIFINQALAANTEKMFEESNSLTAKYEQDMPFNGAGALQGNTINLDEILSEASA